MQSKTEVLGSKNERRMFLAQIFYVNRFGKKNNTHTMHLA